MVWSVMSDPLGLSIGTTNLVAARVGNQPVIRRSVLTLADGTLSGPDSSSGSATRCRWSHPDGSTASGRPAVGRRVGADGRRRAADSRRPRSRSRCPPTGGMATLRSPAHRTARTRPGSTARARLVSDAVASLTALQTNPGLPAQGVVALLDFGGGGTSTRLADAGASFEPMDETTRYTDFSGDQIDQAMLSHIVDGIAATGGIDPAGTAAVGSLRLLREECRPRQGTPVRRHRGPRSSPTCPATGRLSG